MLRVNIPAAIFILFFSTSASAINNGPYIGISAGSAIIQDSRPAQESFDNNKFDSDDGGYKIFAGMRLDSFSLEFGYVDFGSPDDTSATVGVLEYGLNGYDILGLVHLTLGPLDVFGKGGLFVWDSETKSGVENLTADGADPVYGVGVNFSLGSLSLRGEYEFFDVGEIDDVYMFSVGAVLTF